MAPDRPAAAESRPIRLFVAFEVPSAIRRGIDRAVAPWREQVPGARWAPVENWHVTLKFLGRTDPASVPKVSQHLEDAASASIGFQTAATGMGAFPSWRRARVMWVGLEDEVGVVSTLAERVEDALTEGPPEPTRPFRPHLTVARFDPPAALPRMRDVKVPSTAFTVDRIVLFRSHLGRPAPRYEALREFRLES